MADESKPKVVTPIIEDEGSHAELLERVASEPLATEDFASAALASAAAPPRVLQMPTVCRIVQYRLGDKIRPAIVVAVNADGTVDLQVFLSFNEGVGEERHRGMGLRQSVAQGDVSGTWSWPPRA